MLGLGGEALRSSEVYTSIYRQISIILYLIYDTGRSRIGVGVPGAEPPEAQRFWAINYGQMSIF